MTGVHDHQTDERAIDEVLAQVRRLEARIVVQEHELARLRAATAATPASAATAAPAELRPTPATDAPTLAVPAPERAPLVVGRGLGRRRLLVGGATAAAAGVAGVVATGQAAAAAPGDPLVLGASNDAGETTTVLGSEVQDDPVLLITNAAPPQPDTEPGGIWGSASWGYGVRGSVTMGNGVEGRSGQVGVHGSASAPEGVGVSGSADDGTGVRASGLVGVDAVGNGGFDTGAIQGFATQGAGVVGTSAASRGLEGRGPVGLWAEATDVAAVLTAPGAHIRFGSTAGRSAPTADTTTHDLGDVVLDGAGVLWTCVAAGTPGTWRTVAGPGAAGQLHLLPTPVRVYDSRPSGTPAVGPKTKLQPGTPRTIDCRANASGVPAGATAVAVAILVVNAPVGPGNLTIWAGGAPAPATNAMVWGGDAGRFSSPATSRVDAAGAVQVMASVATHVVLDVVGYHL